MPQRKAAEKLHKLERSPGVSFVPLFFFLAHLGWVFLTLPLQSKACLRHEMDTECLCKGSGVVLTKLKSWCQSLRSLSGREWPRTSPLEGRSWLCQALWLWPCSLSLLAVRGCSPHMTSLTLGAGASRTRISQCGTSRLGETQTSKTRNKERRHMSSNTLSRMCLQVR